MDKEAVTEDERDLVVEGGWKEVESHFVVTVHAFGDGAFKKYQHLMRSVRGRGPSDAVHVWMV